MKHPPGELQMLWLIARRAAWESLHDRMSLVLGIGVALLLPLGLVSLEIRPLVGTDSLGTALAFNLLVVGLLPALSAVGVASGQFAGEKERGVLTPLLASPASNVAIFGGKVLGSILPSLLYALVAETTYTIGVVNLLGLRGLTLIPLGLAVAMVLLVPAMTCFAANVASLISSRVRTFNSAQQLAGLVLMPVWGILVGFAARLPEWGAGGLMGAVGGLALLDVALTVIAARTWRREEVLSHG